MPWFKGDDRLHSCPKWAPLSFAARGLWAHAASWCADRLTDGHVPRDMPRAWGAPPELAAELVESGLWEATPDGYVFHDWLDYNPSREQVEQERQKTAVRQQRWRDRHPRNGVRNGVTNAHVTGAPDPDPVKKNSSLNAAASSAPATHTDVRSVQTLAAAGRVWFREVLARDDYDHRTRRWREPFEALAEKPDHEKAAAAETIRQVLGRNERDRRFLTPDHVLAYWQAYVDNDPPGRRTAAGNDTQSPASLVAAAERACDAAERAYRSATNDTEQQQKMAEWDKAALQLRQLKENLRWTA